jgi:hypothetical protein
MILVVTAEFGPELCPFSPFSASLLITIIRLRYLCITLVYSSSSSIYDSTEEAIKRMIEASQRMININDDGGQGGEGGGEKIRINPAVKKHSELQIKTLQNAPRRGAAKLEQIIKAKERENDKVRHLEDTQRLVTEIEMLKFVLYLVNRNRNTTQRQG